MATCGYCYKDKIVRFKLRLLQWITSIDCNIENFYQTCQCGHFYVFKHNETFYQRISNRLF